MKISLPIIILTVALTSRSFGQALATPDPRTVANYHDVLAIIPNELRALKPPKWTEPQRSAANELLKTKLVDPHVPVRLHVKVDSIERWGGGKSLVLYASVPNQEGYSVKVFASFADPSTLTKIKKGDMVFFRGVASKMKFEEVWGHFTLSICGEDCVFIK